VIEPGRSFDRFASDYERGRPSWPARALDLAANGLGLDRGGTVLDLGAGTGKLTRLLVERFDRVLAVEPGPRMRALLPEQAEVVEGTAEDIPLRDGSVAAVFCGESFHWFDWPRAVPEIARVLRRRGGLILMWNRPSGGLLSSADWPEEVSAALGRLDDPSPPERRYGSFAWRDALAGSPFEELRSDVVPNRGEIDRETLLARIGSWSPVTSLDEAERERFLSEIPAYLTEPTYAATLETHVYWTRLVS
jgi:SAM-dependent methyltransferase